MQSDNYLDKDNDKTGHWAMKYSESHMVFYWKFPVMYL